MESCVSVRRKKAVFPDYMERMMKEKNDGDDNVKGHSI